MACPIKARLTHPRILKAKATGLTLLVVLLVALTLHHFRSPPMVQLLK
jgi:hypothetical protein